MVKDIEHFGAKLKRDSSFNFVSLYSPNPGSTTRTRNASLRSLLLGHAWPGVIPSLVRDLPGRR